MAVSIDAKQYPKTIDLTAKVLSLAEAGSRVQFLCDSSVGPHVVQRMRVALSRSRKKNISRGKKVKEFTLCHSIHPYTDSSGKRHDAVVMWINKTHHHLQREILDDLLER